MSEEMLSALDEVYTEANRLVAAIDDDQWAASTPCTEWDVRALVNHMMVTSKVLAASARRQAPSADAEADHLGDDPTGSFAAQGADTLAAWRGQGALDGMVEVPVEMPAVAALGVNILDVGTHVWDLATATGQPFGLSDTTIGIIDEWNHNVVSDEVRAGGGFGEVLEPASGDRLSTMLAFVGRSTG
ncbi:MAG: TIGR03086 family metal-binding protein [Acidimicrobiia bacterium]|nr:TIGR03086 family metal-binding protein [Acidimicrobiia bacterium]